MARFANELREHIIQPTLKYLGAASPQAESLLLTMALLSNRFRRDDERLGVYCISPQQHRQVWDDYLAFQPDLASEIRSLASQRWFLENPDRELIANIAYATAIAWIIFSISGMALPAANDVDAQARIWQRLFGPYQEEGEALSSAIDKMRGRMSETSTPPPASAKLK
ncbi:MAG: hypothetical protein ABW049_09390 [Spongiibacteraceae bacterium]